MILPNKDIMLRYSILGTGTLILRELKNPQTVSSLWEKIRNIDEINNFEKFFLILDFLYMMNLIELEEGLVRIYGK